MGQIISGLGSLKCVSNILKQLNYKNILLVCGKKSFKSSGAEEFLKKFLNDNQFIEFSNFRKNPDLNDAKRGAILAKKKNIDLILAIGGGSVLDMGKLIKAFYNDPQKAENILKGTEKVSDNGIFLIAVPTTAGSGSEATHFAVVYMNCCKYSIASNYILPDLCILDGQLIKSNSYYQMAYSGLDALAQGIESSWSINSTNQSRILSLNATKDCYEYLCRMPFKEKDENSFQKLLNASNLAGQAINISKTTAAHAWSYSFTSHFKVPHGHAVWLTLPRIFQIHCIAEEKDITDPRGNDHLKNIMKDLLNIFSISEKYSAERILKKLLFKLKVESEFKNIGLVSKNMRLFCSQDVNLERMSNNPVNLKNYVKWIFDI